MERFRQWVRRAFGLPMKWALALAAGSLGLLLWVFTHDSPPLMDHAALYLFAYALAVLVTAITRAISATKARLENAGWFRKLMDSPLMHLIRGDPAFRAWMGVFLSMVWNVVVALVKLLAGRVLHSEWLRSLGTYYLALAALRLLIIVPSPPSKRDAAWEWRRYRACGVALMAMNLVLIRMVFQIVTQKGRFHYPGPLIYLMMIYAFWAIANATVKLITWHRRADPRLSASRAVSLTAALVSLLALETAMIARFSDAEAYHRALTALSGGVICMAELGIALYMIRRGKRMIAAAEERGEEPVNDG